MRRILGGNIGWNATPVTVLPPDPPGGLCAESSAMAMLHVNCQAGRLLRIDGVTWRRPGRAALVPSAASPARPDGLEFPFGNLVHVVDRSTRCMPDGRDAAALIAWPHWEQAP